MTSSYQAIKREWEQTIDEIYTALRKRIHVTPIPGQLCYALEFLTISALPRHETSVKLAVINGPGGIGKSTLGHMIERLGFHRIPRITDRPQRKGEIGGKDYHFVDTKTFSFLWEKGDILAAKTTYGFQRGFLKEDFMRIANATPPTGASLAKGGPHERYYTEGESALRILRNKERQFDKSLDPELGIEGPLDPELGIEGPLDPELGIEGLAAGRFGLRAEEVCSVFLLPPSFEHLLARLSAQRKAGYFSHAEMLARLQEGLHFFQKSVEHLPYFPHSVYLVDDERDRLFYVVSALLTQGASGEDEQDAIVPVVDESDNPVSVSTKTHSHHSGLLHPTAVVYVHNGKGELLLQKRRDTGKWDHSAAGHVFPGESYRDAAARELAEELGIKGAALELVGNGEAHYERDYEKIRHRFALFSCRFDGRLASDPREVAGTRFVNPEALEREFGENPDRFSSGFLANYDWYRKRKE